MKQLTIDKYKHASAFLKERSIRLWEHENSQNGISRNTAQIVFPIKFAYVQKISDDGEILVFRSLSFLRHLDYCKKTIAVDNASFDEGNALKVLESMYNLSIEKQSNKSFEYYIENVCTESCCYIIYQKGNEYYDKILRVDLFRKLDFVDEKADFSGGLFHALKHFTLRKTDKTHRNYITDIEELMYYCAYAFFIGETSPFSNENNIIKTTKNPRHYSSIKFVYFHELDSKVSFIKTIIPLKK